MKTADKLEKAQSLKKRKPTTKKKAARNNPGKKATAKKATAKKATAKKAVKKAVAKKTTKRLSAKKATRKAPAKKTAGSTATDEVLKIVKRTKKGVDVPALIKKTGFNEKKVRNIVARAFKQKRIKRTGRGVYAAA